MLHLQVAKLSTEPTVVADLDRAHVSSKERKAVRAAAAQTLKPPVPLQLPPQPDSNNSKRRAAQAERLALASVAASAAGAPDADGVDTRPAKRMRDDAFSSPLQSHQQREPHNFFSSISNAATADGVSAWPAQAAQTQLQPATLCMQRSRRLV